MMTCSAWLSLVLLAAIAFPVMCQEFAGCRESYFLSNGDCLPCPANCITCISKTNCTQCSSNYYGLTCQQECLQECEDICHKKYGYCTYGCVDGQFPEEDEAHCSNCPSNCTLCKSSSACVMCHPGRHGKTCEHPCENNCDTCDQKSGNCMACAEGYFNRDGRCNKCPDGCVGCYDNKNCSVCKVDYSRLHDGQCIMKCPSDENEMKSVFIGQDESGIPKEQTVKDTCKGSQECSYKTTTPCIKSMPCPEGHHCPTKDNDAVICAAILTYGCFYKYQPLNGSYLRCEPNCSIENRNPYSLSFCLSSTETVSVQNVHTIIECSQASTYVDTGSCLQGCHETVLIPLLSVFLVALCTLIVLTISIMYRGRRSMSKDIRQEETCAKCVISETGTSESYQLNMISEAVPLINEQEFAQEHTYTMNIEERLEGDVNVAMFVEPRTDILDVKPLQQNTPMIREARLLLERNQEHSQEPTYTMDTEELTELDDKAGGLEETRAAFLDTKHKHPLIREAKLIINKQESMNTMKTEERSELDNKAAGFVETRTDTLDPLMDKQKHTHEPLVTEKRTELDDTPKGLTETSSGSLETEPYQQNTYMMPEVDPLKSKQEQTKEPTKTMITEDPLRGIDVALGQLNVADSSSSESL